MKYSMLRAAAVSPSLIVADCEYNAGQIITLIREAYSRGARLAVFPELCITGYTCADLFAQSTLLQAARQALLRIAAETKELGILSVVGLPLAVDGVRYNTAAFVNRGEVLAVVPKAYIPNYSEFYERRWFSPPVRGLPDTIALSDEQCEVPFGLNVLLQDKDDSLCKLAAEICEDLTDFKSGFVSYDDFKKRCGLLGIPLDEKELGKMFVLDYLIANGDRHLNNFGFLRDSDTLEWKGLCPVYDSGSSMFYDKVDFEIDSRIGISERGLLSKPFSDNYVKQLLLFPFVDCIREMPLERLRGIGDFYKDLLSKNERNIPREKIDRLAEVIQCRAEMLGEFKDARSVSDLPVVRKFLETLDGVSSAENFKEFVQEKYRKVTENDDIKKELLSFYLYGLNSKSEKDFERKIKQFVNRREIDIDGYGR